MISIGTLATIISTHLPVSILPGHAPRRAEDDLDCPCGRILPNYVLGRRYTLRSEATADRGDPRVGFLVPTDLAERIAAVNPVLRRPLRL
jgi:hypothetical protein